MCNAKAPIRQRFGFILMVVSGALILAVIAGVQTVQYREVSKSREERASSLEERKQMHEELKDEMERSRIDRERATKLYLRLLQRMDEHNGKP